MAYDKRTTRLTRPRHSSYGIGFHETAGLDCEIENGEESSELAGLLGQIGFFFDYGFCVLSCTCSEMERSGVYTTWGYERIVGE